MDYRQKFIDLATPLEEISKSFLMSQFANGLKAEVKSEVKMLKPFNLNKLWN